MMKELGLFGTCEMDVVNNDGCSIG